MWKWIAGIVGALIIGILFGWSAGVHCAKHAYKNKLKELNCCEKEHQETCCKWREKEKDNNDELKGRWGHDRDDDKMRCKYEDEGEDNDRIDNEGSDDRDDNDEMDSKLGEESDNDDELDMEYLEMEELDNLDALDNLLDELYNDRENDSKDDGKFDKKGADDRNDNDKDNDEDAD